MWSRKELKEKSKIRFRANYWKMVLVALILSFIVGAGSSATAPDYTQHYDETDLAGTASFNDASTSAVVESVTRFFSNVDPAAIVLGIIIALVIFLIILAVVIAVDILLLNPLEIGCKRFCTKNLNEDARLKEICYSFDNGYKNAIKTMFFRNLYVFLWSLLLVIPGIVKSYEYRMIPYLLGENPQMPAEQAFALSKQMMTGNKWDAFVLDLSFLGWEILSALTFGILGIFYVNPYYHQTAAALYEALKLQNQSIPEQNI